MFKTIKNWFVKKREATKYIGAGVIATLLFSVLTVSATNISYIPVEDDYLQELTQTLGDSATDLTIYVDVAPVYSPTTTDTYAVIEPGTTRQEAVLIDSYDGTALTLTIASGGRGQNLYLGDVRSTKIFEHPAGSEIMISDNYLFWQDIFTAVNSKLDNDGGNTTTTFDLDLSGSDFRIRFDGGDMKFTDDNQAEVTLSSLASLSGSNDKVKVTNSDTTEGYIDGKLVDGSGLVKTVNNPGANETYELDVDLSEGGIVAGLLANVISDVTATATEINDALDGIGASVTAANLTTMTSGTSSDADSLHTHPKLGGAFSLTAGEAIDGSSTPQFLAQATSDNKGTLTVHENGIGTSIDLDWNDITSRNIGNVDNSTRRAQSFTFTESTASTIEIEEIRLFIEKVVNPTDNIFLEIHGDNSDKPDNTPITNGTSDVIAGTALQTVYQWQEFTFSTPPELTSGTKYWIVIKRSGVNDAVNYYHVGDYNANKYDSHGTSTYTASTQTWTSETVADWAMQVKVTYDFGGKVFKLDSDNLERGGVFLGTTEDNVAADAAITVLPPGNTQDSFSGLTTGIPYYASTTAGVSSSSIGQGEGEMSIFFGKAISATDILLGSGPQYYYQSLSEVNFNEHTAAYTADLTILTGFKPAKITLRYTKAESAGAANDGFAREQVYFETTTKGGMVADSLDNGNIVLTAVSTIEPEAINTSANDYMLPIEMFNNGFELRFKEDEDLEVFASIQILVEGY
jgi:hypothetical protein